MSDPIDIRSIRARAECLAGPSVAKASRGELKSKSHAAFLEAFLACGMNQSELAAHLGFSRQYVHDWVHGRRPVPDYVLRGIPRAGKIAIAVGYLDDAERTPDSDRRAS